MKTPIFFLCCKRGFSGCLEGVILKIFPIAKSPGPIFSSTLLFHTKVLVVRIHNRPFLYRFSCHWPAFYQTRVGLVQLHFREVGNFYLRSLGVQTEFIKMNTYFLEESGL